MSKRSRGEAFDAGTELVKIESAVAQIVGRVSLWRDLCGCEFSFFKKLEKSSNSATLKIGPFDEVKTDTIVELSTIRLPGDYCVEDFCVDVEKKALCFTITRGRVEPPEGKHVKFTKNENDLKDIDFKTRIAKPEDSTAVRAAIETITKDTGTSDWAVKELPTNYALRFKFRKVVPANALKESAGFSGSKMDFDTGTLVVFVPKKKPDLIS